MNTNNTPHTVGRVGWSPDYKSPPMPPVPGKLMPVVQRRLVRPVEADGRTFDSELEAALHILWLIQRLSYEDGSPADGPRFREGTLAARKLIKDLGYEPGKSLANA